mgnify:CR=1 FL=1
MAELKKVARGGKADKVTTIDAVHDPCLSSSGTETMHGESQVLVEGFPIAYQMAEVMRHTYRVGTHCEFHTPTIRAVCKTVKVGVGGVGGVLQLIASEDDTVIEGLTGALECGVVGPVQQSSVWVGV